jgi:hypothetical protein
MSAANVKAGDRIELLRCPSSPWARELHYGSRGRVMAVRSAEGLGTFISVRWDGGLSGTLCPEQGDRWRVLP